MAFCEKCGANLADGTKFCDKCGAPTSAAAPAAPAQPYGGAPVGYVPVMAVAPKTPLLQKIKGIIPAQYLDPKNKTMFWIGWGSTVALALLYIISLFWDMDAMCAFIAGISFYGEASEAWMVFYFIIGLFPAVFVVTTLKNVNQRLFAVFAAFASLFLLILGLICWGAIDSPDSANGAAWYVLMDAVSDIWYLKMLAPFGMIIGFGCDYIANKVK